MAVKIQDSRQQTILRGAKDTIEVSLLYRYYYLEDGRLDKVISITTEDGETHKSQTEYHYK